MPSDAVLDPTVHHLCRRPGENPATTPTLPMIPCLHDARHFWRQRYKTFSGLIKARGRPQRRGRRKEPRGRTRKKKTERSKRNRNRGRKTREKANGPQLRLRLQSTDSQTKKKTEKTNLGKRRTKQRRKGSVKINSQKAERRRRAGGLTARERPKQREFGGKGNRGINSDRKTRKAKGKTQAENT